MDMPKYKVGDILRFSRIRYPNNTDQTLVIIEVTTTQYVFERRYKFGRTDPKETYRFDSVDSCTELDMDPLEYYVLTKLKEKGYIA